MVLYYSVLLLLFSTLSSVVAFTPPFSVCSGVAHDAVVTMTPMASTALTNGVDALSPSLSAGANILLISMAEGSESATRQGLINWGNPAEAVGGIITLLYIVFSILAGIKYVVKDGWRPKF